jgi:hypothetical protein
MSSPVEGIAQSGLQQMLSTPANTTFLPGLRSLPSVSLDPPRSPLDIVLLSVGFYGLASAGIGFTRPNSLSRAALLPPIGYATYLLGRYSWHIMPRLLVSNLLAGTVAAACTQYVVSAYLLKENFEDAGPQPGGSSTYPSIADIEKPTGTPADEHSRRRPDTWYDRLLFGLNTVNSQRNVLTPQRARDIPPFSSKDPEWVPDRNQFLLRRGAVMLVSLLVIDMMTSSPGDSSGNAVTFAQYKTALYRPLGELLANGGEELKTRIMATFAQWFGLYVVMTWIHSTIAFFTVLLGFYQPEAWPPLFGSITEMWNLRQHWGRFWHSMMRYKLSATGDFVTYDVLGLERGSFAARYSHLFSVFGASGICHIIMDIVGPIKLSESRGLQFFILNAVGICIEDFVQYLWRRGRGKTRKEDSGKPRLWVRLLGGAWVVAWEIFVTPMWAYPGLRAAVRVQGKKGEFLPFSIVQGVKRFFS